MSHAGVSKKGTGPGASPDMQRIISLEECKTVDVIPFIKKLDEVREDIHKKLSPPTKEDYLSAKKIVDDYEIEQERLFQIQLVKLEDELKAYFAAKKVGGRFVKQFRLEKGWAGNYIIIPLDPFMDEDYMDDDADEEIDAIGSKYGLTNFGFISSVYPK